MTTDPTEDRIRRAMIEAEVAPPAASAAPAPPTARSIGTAAETPANPDAPKMAAPEARRPISSRTSNLAKWAAQSLVNSGVTPNQISMASIAAGALAFVTLWGAGMVINTPGRGLLLIIAALAVQARLICNLLDGMVAIEGGQAEADGPIWNEFPDRIADILILGGLGFAAGAPALGFLAAALAVCTAYVRELGVVNGASPDFSGPMAKQHRMAAVTGAAILSAFWPMMAEGAVWVLWLALWGIVLGTAFTVGRRALRLVEWLRLRQRP